MSPELTTVLESELERSIVRALDGDVDPGVLSAAIECAEDTEEAASLVVEGLLAALVAARAA